MAIIDFEDALVLVVAPHVDDEVNCAATLSRARREGAHIAIVACSDCAASVKEPHNVHDLIREHRESCHRLGATIGTTQDWPVRRLDDHKQDILEWLVSLRRRYGPDIVIGPSSTDWHQDHKLVYKQVMRAFRNVPWVLGWESPNNQRTAVTDVFVRLDEADLEAKLDVWRIYKTQHHREHFDAALIRSLAVVRGKQCRSDTGLAEAFEHRVMVL